MPIPRKLHRILVWGYDPGVQSQSWWRRFSALHPGWSLQTWTDDIDPDDFELGRLFRSCSSGAQLADLLRIEILWRFGGIYVDTDVEPLKSLEPLTELDAFFGTEDGEIVSSGVIGASPQHPALRELMDRLLEYEELPPLSARLVTGPLFYTRCFELRRDIVVLPREVFYPYNPYIGITKEGARLSHSFCVHHWAASWATSEEVRPEQKKQSGRSRVRKEISNIVRQRLLPIGRRLAPELLEIPPPSRGTYLGGNRLLILTTDGFRMHVPANDLSLTPELATRGWYDDKLLRFMDTVLRPGDWFIDVGANVGLFTLAAAKRIGRQGRAIAFEADPELATICGSEAIE